MQAFSQQTPSTHWSDLHSLAFAHGCPFCLGPQLPLTQAIPDVAVGVGLAGPRAGPGDAAERRAVLQARRAAGAEPVAGRRGVQLVAGAGRRQADGPQRVERAPAHAVAASVLTAAGGPLVLADAVRIDGAVDRPARRSRRSRGACRRRTAPGRPSCSRCRRRRSPSSSRRWSRRTQPMGRLPQLPLESQACPATHWLEEVQWSRQAPLRSQENGAQMMIGPDRQLPAPSQTLWPTTAPAWHVPEPHGVPSGDIRQLPVPSHVPVQPADRGGRRAVGRVAGRGAALAARRKPLQSPLARAGAAARAAGLVAAVAVGAESAGAIPAHAQCCPMLFLEPVLPPPPSCGRASGLPSGELCASGRTIASFGSPPSGGSLPWFLPAQPAATPSTASATIRSSAVVRRHPLSPDLRLPPEFVSVTTLVPREKSSACEVGAGRGSQQRPPRPFARRTPPEPSLLLTKPSAKIAQFRQGLTAGKRSALSRKRTAEEAEGNLTSRDEEVARSLEHGSRATSLSDPPSMRMGVAHSTHGSGGADQARMFRAVELWARRDSNPLPPASEAGTLSR